mmetsp:Transcript_52139/g.124210  ORF Transcript_52139/g.124210 Transcript_52139/m.124210 type:complete len:125 (+) Transcript_52139:190-564(+)
MKSVPLHKFRRIVHHYIKCGSLQGVREKLDLLRENDESEPTRRKSRLDEHKHPVSVSFDQDDSNDMAMVESPADLARGLQWLSNAEEPREMEIPAGASAEDIRCEEEIEKARLRVWLATMLDVL